MCLSDHSSCLQSKNGQRKGCHGIIRIAVSALLKPQGLYHPRNEHDACGMGLVASIRGEKSHEIIRKGLEVLINLTHRGAAGCDPETGDGAGILIQIPHDFFVRECGELGMQAARSRAPTAWPCASCPSKSTIACSARASSSASPRKKASPFSAGATRRSTATPSAAKPAPRSPTSSSSSSAGPTGLDEDAFERLLYRVRRRTENEIAASEIEDKETFYVPSFSCRTIIYKGLMLAPQIEKFYFELANPLVTSALCARPPALLHQHVSQLEAGPSLPLRRAQRRNQHHPRQRELDERAPVGA